MSPVNMVTYWLSAGKLSKVGEYIYYPSVLAALGYGYMNGNWILFTGVAAFSLTFEWRNLVQRVYGNQVHMAQRMLMSAASDSLGLHSVIASVQKGEQLDPSQLKLIKEYDELSLSYKELGMKNPWESAKAARNGGKRDGERVH